MPMPSSIANASKNGQRRLIDSAPWQHELFIRQRLWIHNFIPVQTFAVARAAYFAIGGLMKPCAPSRTGTCC